MTEFQFTEEPPEHWRELCARHGDLFNTPEWHAVLAKGFGSKTLYGWDESSSAGITITVFKAGPFRVGYVGFPVGGTVGNGIDAEMIDAFKRSDFPVTLHTIRIPISAFISNANLPLPVQVTPETAIEDVQNWNPEVGYKLRRTVNKAKNKAKRLGLRVVDASADTERHKFFNLYRKTILRHSGNMRYTPEYFDAMLKLSELHNGIRCMLAVKGEDIVGYVVVACHQGSAYCLHSATDLDFKNNRSNDLLFYDAITWAKRQGMTSFSFIASPPNQPSLTDYKEKWGGVTKEQRIYELALRPFQAAAFRVSAKVYQRLF